MAATTTDAGNLLSLRETSDTINRVTNKLVDFLVDYGRGIVGGLIIILAGLVIARWLGRVVMGWLEKREMDPPLRTLIVRVVRLIIFAFTLVLALEKVGVPIAPMVAGIGVVGVGIGLATQGVLSNLVAGLTIIFTRPFRVGEYVELAGVHGRVTQVELFSTTLLHGDMSQVVIPNRKIVGEILHNYGLIRQIEINVGVAYETDLDAAFRVAHETVAAHPAVLKNPAPVIGITNLGEYAITLSIKPWTKLTDFGSAQADLNRAIIERFREHKIEIPVPLRQVRVLSGDSNAAVG